MNTADQPSDVARVTRVVAITVMERSVRPSSHRCGVACRLGPPTDVGEACTGDADCSRGTCLDRPGGYCSAGCEENAECGPGNVCSYGGACFVGCESHASCTRSGYFCTYVGTHFDEELNAYDDYGCDIGDTVGGTASIPAGITVVLTDAHAGTITLTSSGPFTLPNRIATDSDYDVALETTVGLGGISCVGKGLRGHADDDVTSLVITCGRRAVFTEPGTHTWVVPPGVTSVSVVAVGSGGRGYGSAGGGGGELCYQNAIAVTPGATMQVVVGDLFSTIAGGHDSSFGALVAHGGSDAESSPPGGILGGTGGTVGTCFAGGRGSYNASAGGAAGYAGVGGNAAIDVHPVQNGAGGGGGGGAFSVPGGGVGLEGMGANGIAPGGHGSRATPDVPVAGGGATTYNDTPQNGMHGGVRIIWGAGRSYPSQAGNL